LLEGLQTFTTNSTYKQAEIQQAQARAHEFLLIHKLFRSDHTGEVIDARMTRLSFPPRWRYDVLRALDYLQMAQFPFDERLGDGLELLTRKRRKDGTWPLQQRHPGRTFFELEQVGKPSRWSTLRALRVFKFYQAQVLPSLGFTKLTLATLAIISARKVVIMPRPTTKADLVQQIEGNYDKLQTLVQELSKAEITGPNVTTKWTTKDVLAHLTEWTHMMLSWHKAGLRGETPAMPAEGFNWRQIPALNQQIFEAHKDDALADVQAAFVRSYEEILELAQTLSEDELFERSHFAWTGKNNVATYLISASCSHYDWAYKRIKRTLRPGRREKKAA
jgi:hypothetical protein